MKNTDEIKEIIINGENVSLQEAYQYLKSTKSLEEIN